MWRRCLLGSHRPGVCLHRPTAAHHLAAAASIRAASAVEQRYLLAFKMPTPMHAAHALLPVQFGGLLVPQELVAWTNLGALLLYVGCYQLSFGPISWLLCGEVFPLKVRWGLSLVQPVACMLLVPPESQVGGATPPCGRCQRRACCYSWYT